MKNTDHQTCQNCFHSFHGTYCFNCGQKNTVRRFQLVEILKELLLTPFHIEEHGLTGTFKSLLLHPGRAIREYIKGRRLLLFAPFRYVVLAGAFAAIIAAVYHVFEVGENLDGVVLLQDIDPSFFVFAGKNATAINLLTIPVFALFTWLFFKPKGYYYAENLVLHAYITAQQLWFLVLLLPLFHFFPSLNNEVIQVYSFLTILYNLYVVMSFFNMITLTGFGLSLLALLYSYIFQLLVNYGFFKLATWLGIVSLH